MINDAQKDFDAMMGEGESRNGHRPITSLKAATVEPEEVRWLWDRRIPFGKLTIFDGDPDVGKSAITMDLAARVSTGRTFPDGATCEPGNVAVVNVEDGIADTIVPRLKAHGADLERVEIIPGVPTSSDSTRLIDIPDDVLLLEEFITEHAIKLLIIDPVLTMLGGDANKDQDARKALAPLRDMAERTGCAIVAVRHLNKNVSLKAIQRGGGNMGLIGVARAGAFFAQDPEDDKRRIMAAHKSNLAEKPPSLLYRIVTSEVHNTARIEWCGVSEYDANALAADASTPHEKSELDEAKKFLRDELSDGPMWSKQVYKDAEDAGVARRTLHRAKSALGVRSEKIGIEGWQWSLPSEGDHVGNVGNVQESYEHGETDSPYLSEGCQGCQGCQECQPTLEGGNVQNERRLTEEEAHEVQRLMRKGFGARWARAEVLRGDA